MHREGRGSGKTWGGEEYDQNVFNFKSSFFFFFLEQNRCISIGLPGTEDSVAWMDSMNDK